MSLGFFLFCLAALCLAGGVWLVRLVCLAVVIGDEHVAYLRPVGGSGRKRISHMLKEGFSVGRITRELHVSRGLVLAVKVQMEMEGKR